MDQTEGDITGTWAVHRQDDHGNRFLVRDGLNRDEAERLAVELQSRGHKQVYWSEPESGEVDRPSPRSRG